MENEWNDQEPAGLTKQEVLRRLESLRDIPPRDPSRVAAERSSYLAYARSAKAQAATGSVGFLDRWFGSFLIPLRGKEGRTMVLKLATAAMLVFVLIMGSAAATVYAAQDSLPSEPLYALKLATEDVSLILVGDSPAQFKLALQYFNRRFEEIEAMKAQGDPIEELQMVQLQEQMSYLLQWAAGRTDSEMQAALNQYRNSLMQQEQFMFQAKQMSPPDTELEAALALVQLHQRIAEQGIQEPTLFRQQLRDGNLYGQPEMPGPYGPPEEIPPSEEQKGPGPGQPPEEPGPAEPGPEQKPPGGPEVDQGNPQPGAPQGPAAPGGSLNPGGGNPASGQGGKGPGSGGKGGNSTGSLTIWPTPTPSPSWHK